MNEKDIRNIETTDFDLIENVVVGLREIWKKKMFVVLITLAGLLVAIMYVTIRGNSVKYTSSATLFSAVYGSASDTNEGVSIMNRYSELIKSSRVCNRAAQQLNGYDISAAQLQNMVSNGSIRVSGANTSQMSYGYKLTITVTTDSADIILPITNAMASAFAAELNDLMGRSAIQVMDEATKYAFYNTMNTKMYLLVIPAAAFILACGIIFVFAFFSPVVRSVAQCEQDNDLILGMVPYSKKKANS